jgi:hypothetical protein
MADDLLTPAAGAPDASAAPTPSSGDNAPSPSAPGSQDAPSPSAPSDKGETRESLLDVVQKAVSPEPRPSQSDDADASGAAPAPTTQSGDPAPDAAAADGDLPDDASAEEMDRYGPSAKKRVSKLVKQRNDARAEVERLKGFEQSAQAADSVSTYLRENDIGRDDFLLTLELAAAMRRGDFRAFYEGVKPYVQLAEEYLGIALPADLQQRVREGHMTTQAASAFSRERMDRALAESQRVRTAQQMDATTTQHAQTQLANTVRDTVNAWEAATMQADPDYAAKRAAVQDTMWAVVRERGVPQSADHAVEIAKESYRRVNERFRSWTPPRRPTSRTPSSTGRTNGAAPEARNLTEVVQQAIERARP